MHTFVSPGILANFADPQFHIIQKQFEEGRGCVELENYFLSPDDLCANVQS